MKKTLFTLLFAFTFLLSSCGKSSSPPKSEVLNYLNAQVPAASALEFTSVETENFPEGDDRCRVKIKATLRCKTDLYKAVDYSDALKSAGGDPVAYQKALLDLKTLDEPFKTDLTGKIPAFGLKGVMLGQVATHADQEGTAYGTLEAERQVDHWTMTTIELQNVGANFPGRTAESVQGLRLLPVDSSEAKQLLADEANRERDFVAQVKSATDQMASIRAAANQVKQEHHAAQVKALLAATAPGKSYVGSITSQSKATRIKLTFLTQEEGGKVLTATFENPDDPTQVKALKGTIAFDPLPGDNQPDLPIRLSASHTTFLRAQIPDHLLNYWLHDTYSVIGFKLNGPDGGLSGRGEISQFDLHPADTTNTAAAPPAMPPQ